MKKVLTAASVVLLLVAAPAFGQEKSTAAAQPAARVIVSPGEITPTPEMWFYEQYRSDYQDPKLAVRRKAEFQADQRLRRMASLKWFGFSNQRPPCSSDPFHGDWSPAWTSNNWFYPSRWQGSNGGTWVVVRPEAYGTVVR